MWPTPPCEIPVLTAISEWTVGFLQTVHGPIPCELTVYSRWSSISLFSQKSELPSLPFWHLLAQCSPQLAYVGEFRLEQTPFAARNLVTARCLNGNDSSAHASVSRETANKRKKFSTRRLASNCSAAGEATERAWSFSASVLPSFEELWRWRHHFSFNALYSAFLMIFVSGNNVGVGDDREDTPNRSYRKQPLLLKSNH